MSKLTPNEIKKALECCNSEHLGCGNCPLNEFGGNCGVVLRNGCNDLINQYEAEIEDLEVEKLHLTEFLAESERKVKDLEVEIKAMRGAAEHPVKTRLTDFLEKYPNAHLIKDNTPLFCCVCLGYDGARCDKTTCIDCWNTPLTGGNT